MRASLVTNPKVIRMSLFLASHAPFIAWFRGVVGATGVETLRDVCDAQAVTRVTVASLLMLWSNVNSVASEDGCVPGATLEVVDAMAMTPGLGAAMHLVGWIEDREEGLHFPNFDEYNIVGKSRSGAGKSGAQRSREWRQRKAAQVAEQAAAAKAAGDSATDEKRDGETSQQRHGDGREDKSRGDKTEGSNSLTAASDVGGAAAPRVSETVSGDAPDAPAAPAATTAGLLSRAFRERGVQCTPSNPDLVALVEQGVSLETAIAAADHARISKPDGQLPLRYVTRILEDWATRPTVNAAGAEAPSAKGGGAWWRSDETALAMANQVGVGPARSHESRTEWHARIQAAIDNGGKPPAPAQAQRQADPIALPPDERTGPSDASRSAIGSISSLLKAKVVGGGIPA